MKRLLSTIQQTTSHHSSTANFPKIPKCDINSDVSSSANKFDKDEQPNTKKDLERDPAVLSRRQKQIDYAKNTVCYEKYLKIVPKHKRTKEHPKTPPKQLKMSRRAWDGLVKNWRLKLHKWDPVSETDDLELDKPEIDKYSFLETSENIESDSEVADTRRSHDRINE